mmetsp:Transcript_129421/g.224693  ORF Transcript_129421/g.224693 Transcript_129421/m.224693 type:complete len:507 (-) Transcript_129421:128-1648(-)
MCLVASKPFCDTCQQPVRVRGKSSGQPSARAITPSSVTCLQKVRLSSVSCTLLEPSAFRLTSVMAWQCVKTNPRNSGHPSVTASMPLSVTSEHLQRSSCCKCGQPAASSSTPSSVTQGPFETSTSINCGQPLPKARKPASVTDVHPWRMTLSRRQQPSASTCTPTSVSSTQQLRSNSLMYTHPRAKATAPKSVHVRVTVSFLSCAQPPARACNPESVTDVCGTSRMLRSCSCAQPSASACNPWSVTKLQPSRSSVCSCKQPAATAWMPPSVTKPQHRILSDRSCGQPTASTCRARSGTAVQYARHSALKSRHRVARERTPKSVTTQLDTFSSWRFLQPLATASTLASVSNLQPRSRITCSISNLIDMSICTALSDNAVHPDRSSFFSCEPQQRLKACSPIASSCAVPVDATSADVRHLSTARRVAAIPRQARHTDASRAPSRTDSVQAMVVNSLPWPSLTTFKRKELLRLIEDRLLSPMLVTLSFECPRVSVIVSGISWRTPSAVS